MILIAGGNQRAFRVLAGRYLPRTLRLAGRMTGNHADAEEITQEALLRVWTTAPRWRPTAAFRTWLYRVVVNLVIDRRRRPSFAALEEAGEPADPAPDPAAVLARHETDRLVADEIARLPDRQRAALVLTHYEGLSDIEAADVLGTSVGGVEGLLVRARRVLRARLGALVGN